VIERHPSELGPFSDTVSFDGPGRWTYVSGALGLGPDGQVVSGGVYEETLAVYASIARSLERHGASLRDIVRTTAYLTELDSYPDFSRARAETFGDAPPASVAIGVAGLLMGARVEIDAVAFVPRD
jgi:2-iminobutanoate/2-iminopropanoate deaminase